MAVFEGLSERFSHIITKLKNKATLSELEIKQIMREIRVALLEADVNFLVVKEFVKKVSEKALGEEILKSLTPSQQVIKIVNEEMIALMGSTHSKLKVASKPPTIILMCGLQGSGKTTICGKLAKMLKAQGKKPMLVACDIYRPAAIEQLKVVAGKAGVAVFEQGKKNPVKIVKSALKEVSILGIDTVIVDTAGRLHIDTELMEELKDLKKAFSPDEILFVADSMTGQDAVNVAKKFDEELDITGVILTKLDGDTRGGAALSIKAVTGKPIKYCGVGEKLEDIEPFHPDRMASRILGMGDVLTLIEKAQTAYSEEEAQHMQKKMRENSFTLDDYLKQFDKMKSMGNMADMVKMIPGMNKKLKGQSLDIDDKKIAHTKAIILSMTMEERDNPDIIKAGRRKRISKGSGTTIQEVNQLLKQFYATKSMMKQMSGKGKNSFKMPF